MGKEPKIPAHLQRACRRVPLAGALIKARGDADMTQEEVAKAMGTTQAVIARLESGRAMPSTRTLKRFAAATGTTLRFSFDPAEKPKAPANSA